MASNVQVLLDVNRNELYQEGWGGSRYAPSMVAAELDPETGLYKPSALPQGLWKEPSLGILMLRPSTMKPEYWENTLYDAYKLALADFDHDAGQSFVQSAATSAPFAYRIEPKRDSDTFALIECLIDLSRAALLDYLDSTMVWLLNSKDPLAPNEGFSVWVHPPGIYTDRATDYLVFGFGQYYALHLRMNGTASLWLNSPLGSLTWREVSVFNYQAGGVEHNRPFQITVIPWGYEYITFLFTQVGVEHPLSVQPTKVQKTLSFLYQIGLHERFPRYDAGSNQYIKTEAASFSVACRSTHFQYNFSFARVRYDSSATLYLTPERMPEVKPSSVPTISWRGFQGAHNGAVSPTAIAASYLNEDGSAWNAAVDTALVPKYVFTPSGDKMYTPELWTQDLECGPTSYNPGWTPIDVSDAWTYIRFKRSVDLDVQSGTVKLEEYDDSTDQLFRLGGPIQVNINSVPFLDGYVVDKHVTLSGPKVICLSELEAHDMWQRLNETLVVDYNFLDGLSILDTIKAMLKRAGFKDADINVVDPSGALAALYFGGFNDPNDQKQIDENANVGDVLREIMKWYGPLPIRIRWVSGQWKIYLAPQYDEATPPTKKFYLRGSLSDNRSAQDRYANHEYFVFSDPEFTDQEPEGNSFIFRTVTSSNDGAQGLQTIIPVLEQDNGALNDPTYVNFMGRAKVVRKSPPEIATASSQQELSVISRSYWMKHRASKRIVEFEAEWQPEIDADDFIWLIGIINDDDGNPMRVSYGAWRIEHADIEMTWDPDDGGDTPKPLWEASANYNMIYVGKAEDDNTKMFTTTLPVFAGAYP